MLLACFTSLSVTDFHHFSQAFVVNSFCQHTAKAPLPEGECLKFHSGSVATLQATSGQLDVMGNKFTR